MKLLLLFTTIVVVGNLAQNLEEESEPSLCLEHQNPFAYTHCIKKRDTACQNGEFCGSCNTNTCQSCNGNSCRTSCYGSACNQCPNGNCCNGQNCNVCSGRNCCTGQSCNNCVNTCRAGCLTPTCQNSCFQTCQTNSCCDRSECFSTCRNNCYEDQCYENCFKQCPCSQNCNPAPPILPPVASSPTIIYPNISFPAPSPPQKANQTIVVVNKPENHNPVNITTIVNLKNYINNKNLINIPINVTNFNHNHFNESAPIQNEKDPIIDNNKCCIVVYPVHCYDIVEPPYKKCIQKREKKCGDICTSVVVHVVHVPGKDKVVPVPYPVHVKVPGPVQVERQPVPYPVPVVQRYPVYISVGTPNQCGISGGCGYRPICRYINRHPWVSCSHYGVQNCGSCYVCGGQYNPPLCSQQLSCAPLCRGGIVNFGNNWQSDILRYAPSYGAQVAVLQPQFDIAQTNVQQPPIGDFQQGYAQQPSDLSAQQQIVQQPVDLMQQPVDYQQAGVSQQYGIPQPVQQQYVAVQQPYVQQPIQQVLQ